VVSKSDKAACPKKMFALSAHLDGLSWYFNHSIEPGISIPKPEGTKRRIRIEAVAAIVCDIGGIFLHSDTDRNEHSRGVKTRTACLDIISLSLGITCTSVPINKYRGAINLNRNGRTQDILTIESAWQLLGTWRREDQVSLQNVNSKGMI
jgi:hypothetical protein